MITTPAEYIANLYRIQDANTPNKIMLQLPSDEKKYKVNLNNRQIEQLTHVTVATDHKAETIYFVVDRYFDNIDLSDTICLIQYINANNKGAIYPVPFYDIESEKGKIIFPWLISGTATEAPGNIKFSIKFYKVSDDKKLIFDLNTIPQTYRIQYGMDVMEEVQEGDNNATILHEFVQRMNELETIVEEKGLYWIE